MVCLLGMELSRFHDVILFLTCIQAVALAVYVEPPTNVTLHCHNMKNTLEWSYNRQMQGLKFKVNILTVLRTYEPIIVESPTLQADISFLSDPKDDYFVTVNAVIGNDSSTEAPPEEITFSYFKDSQANQKCFVDFPSVNVTAQQDGEVFFLFNHPGLLYNHNLPASRNRRHQKKNLNANIRKPLPEFTYDVVVINQKMLPQRFSCEESVCKGKLAADPGQEKHCLKVKGELEKIAVKATQEYCTNTTHEPNKLIYIPIIVAFLLICGVLAFVFFIVYKKKTKSSSPLPRSMMFTSRLRQWTSGTVQEPVQVPEVEPKSPTPLLTPKEKECKESPTRRSSTEADLSSIGEDETQSYGGASNYEKRVVLVQLSPDEETEGYRERS
ncbi:growth/differentiation factor 10b [Antennarius striatus]|uniref:growth/differentiation factor 10b n=1 Tax=Antennarius striatus TaxID=241820 RepID=UPI0035B06F0B